MLSEKQLLNCHWNGKDQLITDSFDNFSGILLEPGEKIRPLSHREKAHLRASFSNIKAVSSNSYIPESAVVQSYLDAAYHLKKLKLWSIISQIILSRMPGQPGYPLHQYLSEKKRFHDQVELCEPIIGKTDTTLDILCLYEVGLAYTFLGDFLKASRLLEKLFQQSKRIDLSLYASRALMGLGRCHDQWGNYRKASQYSLKCINTLSKATQPSDIETTEIIIQAYLVLGRTSFHLRQYRKTIRYCQQAADLAKQIQDRESQWYAFGVAALAHSQIGQPEIAIALLEQQLQQRTENQDPWQISSNAVNLGFAYCYASKFEAASTYFQESIEIGETLGDANTQCFALVALGFMLSFQGDHTSALKHYYRSLSLAQKYDIPSHECFALALLSDLYDDMGDISTSRDYALSAFKLSKKIDIPFFRACAIAMLGLSLWRAKSWLKSIYYLSIAILWMFPWKSGDSKHLLAVIYKRFFLTKPTGSSY